MRTRLRSHWVLAGMVALAISATASAQQPTPRTTAPQTAAGTTVQSLPSLGSLFGFGGANLVTPAQDAQFLTTAVATVQAINQIIPLATGEELLLVFVLYEFEKLNALQGMLFGGGTTTGGM